MKTKLILFALFAASLTAGAFKVTVDTTSLASQIGTIDIQFNPGAFPAVYDPGTATITAFDLGAGSLGSIASGPDGGASGTLPGPLVILNSAFLNGIVYNATFGNTASFFVDFSGDAFTAVAPSILTTFQVSFFGNTSLFAIADLTGNSQIDFSFSSQEANFEAVPEPATFALAALGLAAAIGSRIRRNIR